jgi:hypothetical protein
MFPRRIVVAGTALAAGLALAAPARAQAPTGTLNFHEPASGGTFNIIDNPPKSKQGGARTRFSTKDAIVFSNPLQDASGKRAGTLKVICWITTPGTFATAKSECLGKFVLSNGTIFVSVDSQSFSSTTTDGTVVGGTGSYVGAKGTLHSVQHNNDTSDDTITLTP